MAERVHLEAGAARAMEAVGAVLGPVYLVGGSVRDALLGRSCADLDVATPLAPDEIEARIRAAGRRPHLLGKRFGTIGMSVDGQRVEISTFRTSAYPAQARGPHVDFVDALSEDLAHRDFTINAMAIDAGELVDPHGGRADLDAHVLRAVGDPRARFDEDPLRMVRAARFVAELGLVVDPDTRAAIVRLAPRILDAARERWTLELDRLLLAPHLADGLRLLADTGLLRWMLPDLALQVGYEQGSPWHDRTLFEHTIGVVEGAEGDLNVRWAALLHDVGKPFTRVEKPGRATYVGHEIVGAELAERTALYLRWSADRRERVRRLVRGHMHADSPLRAADDSAKAPRAAAD